MLVLLAVNGPAELASAANLPRGNVRAASILDHAFRAKRPLNVSLTTTKISRDTGWAMPTVRDGIASMLRDAPQA